MALDIGSINIIGCGWLGLPLAQMFLDRGVAINGTTTSSEKLDHLSSLGIAASVLNIYELDQASERQYKADITVINIPPSRRMEQVASLYPQGIGRLFDLHPELLNSFIVFISSTGVYANTGKEVREDAELTPTKASGQALVKAEQLIRDRCSRYVILRLAGLAGPNREPGRWFAGKQNLPGGDTPVNMVHQEDCLQAISLLIGQQPSGEVYNLCAPSHPAKKEFYAHQALKLKLESPTFLDGALPHKVVDGSKIERDLDFTYKWSSPTIF